MEAFISGLDQLFQPAVLVAIVIGSIGGLIIGAVPGIGPAIAIAILLYMVLRCMEVQFRQYSSIHRVHLSML